MPENVRDRDELLLNAIVTGDTSGIEPRDREETFIKAIAEKNTSSLIATSMYPTIELNSTPGTESYDIVTQIVLKSKDGEETIAGYDAIVSNWERLKTPVIVNVIGTGQYYGTTGNVLLIPIPIYSDTVEWVLLNTNSMTFSDVQINKSYSQIRLFVKQ